MLRGSGQTAWCGRPCERGRGRCRGGHGRHLAGLATAPGGSAGDASGDAPKDDRECDESDQDGHADATPRGGSRRRGLWRLGIRQSGVGQGGDATCSRSGDQRPEPARGESTTAPSCDRRLTDSSQGSLSIDCEVNRPSGRICETDIRSPVDLPPGGPKGRRASASRPMSQGVPNDRRTGPADQGGLPQT